MGRTLKNVMDRLEPNRRARIGARGVDSSVISDAEEAQVTYGTHPDGAGP